MSISWGKRERFKFNSGGPLTSWEPPPVAAVYAITYRQDPDRPKSHTILFVGQADDLSSKAPNLNGEVITAWKNSMHDIDELSVFVLPMPGSSQGERFRIQEQLVSEYEPKCNR